ncbi:DUF6153 family protein [Micromonospora endolithica]|uniref:Uncharacterized protein n=1 Tax=Micromonospora endolithica TaxID=230091 RepID=A0A3A9ZQD3_9ACTN|nr:DUF6153 family protein [Micromonospora endolithica]RKN50395.1 hypothetical protein D7223_00905 [Micromonospora endolithica]TWJ20927.1 hypothetical protein JD76_01027 [Micromonospora endolithica]
MNRTARQHPARPTSLPWVLLLVLLTLGVAGMHTFGHGGHAASGHETAANGLPHGALTAADQVDVHQVRQVAQVGEPTTGGSTGAELFSVCLAVLGAFGLAFGLALLRVRSRRATCVAWTRCAAHRGGRGPPVTLLGLRVAAVSVLQI